MSVATQAADRAHIQRTRAELDRASYRLRVFKIVCGIALGICFWYSVPYQLPYLVETDQAIAAAAKAEAATGSASRQIAMPILALISLLMLWRLPVRGRLQGLLGQVALAYVAWAFLSYGWSQDPSITLKRLVVFGIDVLCAYTLARRFSVMEMSLLGLSATSVVALLALYGDVLMQHIFSPGNPEYRFQGVTTANYQAMSLVVGIVCAMTLMDRKPKWTKWLILHIVCALALLYLTRSRMSTIICILLMVVMVTRLAKLRMKPVTRIMVILASLAVVVPGMIYFIGRNGANSAQAAFMMGRNDTQNTSNLSNRAPLWAELWESVEMRPVLGVGYDAFWSAARVAKVSADQGWAVPHAHDSYLDQTLSLGAVGALLYAGMLWGATWVAWKRYRRTRTATDLFPAILLAWLALEGVAESAPLDPYLPSMLAYACIVKMSLVEGSEAESDRWVAPDEVVGGLAPESLRGLHPSAQEEAARWMGAPR